MTAAALAREADVISAAAMHPPMEAKARQRAADEPADLVDSLHVLTCGSVDDGKSTLIGRLLWDSDGLHAEERAKLERSPKTAAGTPDFSLLVDGLAAEQEQGITIDIAWRYLDMPGRRLVIIDSPGHEQYTRNMATGASQADVAILLVDARSGVKEQTRRHAAILDLMGVRRVVLAVNKMDLVGWSEACFAEIEAKFDQIAASLRFTDALAIPVSAVIGDNIASVSTNTPWYDGPTLFEHLGGIPPRRLASSGQLRFPVQLVVRAGDFRGLAGTVASGRVEVGGAIVEPVSGQRARVKRIHVMDRDLISAGPGEAVVLELDADLDVSRGAVLASPGGTPAVVKSFDARLVWLAEECFSAKRGYLLRTATDLVPISAMRIRAQLDLATLDERPGQACEANDIAVARIDVGRPVAVDLFEDLPETGSFILVDPVTGDTIAGGVVCQTRADRARTRSGSFRLTRDLLARGIGADLSVSDGAAEQELRRRANEVAILMREAGVAVEIEDAWGRAGIDADTVWVWTVAVLSIGLVAAVLLGLV